ITYPLILVFAVIPLAITGWRSRESSAGRRALLWTAILLYLMIGGTVLEHLADPQPLLDRLYAATGATPGAFDVAFLKAIYFALILGPLACLIWYLRSLWATEAEHGQALSLARTEVHAIEPGETQNQGNWQSVLRLPATWAILICALG